MSLIDTHAHLYWDSFKEDFDAVIARAVAAGVSTIINIGVDVETSRKALNQKVDLPVYSTIGIHPHESFLDGDITELEKIYFSNPEKVVAVGECGLDYYENKNDKLNQKKLFQAQIDLAKKLNLPLIVHCREAWDETLEMLGDQPAILHCYSGSSQTTLRLRSGQANLYVSFAANITYPKNEYLREAAKILPLDRILLETDSPFLAPQSKRGQRNEPAAVAEIAQLIADLKGISLEQVATQTTKNALTVFSLKLQ